MMNKANMANRWKTLRVLLIVIAASVVSYTAVDIAARLWLRQYYVGKDHVAFYATQPEAYKDAPYFSQHFINELKLFNSKMPRLPDELENVTIHGKYYNIERGIRRVVGQPSNAQNTLYLFGSSTLYGREVPDDHTIASYLQRLLPSYRVENYALGGARPSVLLELLESVTLHPGDIVVFYSGGMDDSAYQILLNRYEAFPICQQLRARIRLIEALCITRSLNFPMPDQQILEQETLLIVQSTRNTFEKARAHVKQHRATFYNILQPAIWSKPLSVYEQTIVSKFSSKVVQQVWQVTQPYKAQLDQQAVDLLHVLDEIRSEGVEVYFDTVHVNHRANEIIAQAIFNLIFPQF